MSSSARFVGMAILLSLVSVGMVRAQGGSGCTATIISLAPCLQFTTGSVTKPSSACCTSLAGVVSSKPECLCSLVDGDGGAQYNVNETLALLLPKVCNVETPPISDCKAVANGTVTPAPAPTTASKAAAPSTPKESGGVKIAGSLFFLFTAFAASYGSLISEI